MYFFSFVKYSTKVLNTVVRRSQRKSLLIRRIGCSVFLINLFFGYKSNQIRLKINHLTSGCEYTPQDIMIDDHIIF